MAIFSYQLKFVNVFCIRSPHMIFEGFCCENSKQVETIHELSLRIVKDEALKLEKSGL